MIAGILLFGNKIPDLGLFRIAKLDRCHKIKGKTCTCFQKSGGKVGEVVKKKKGLKLVISLSPNFFLLFLVPGAGIEPAQPRGPRDFKCQNPLFYWFI
jgi:hypothetical protein